MMFITLCFHNHHLNMMPHYHRTFRSILKSKCERISSKLLRNYKNTFKKPFQRINYNK